jgi:hypothetical protein
VSSETAVGGNAATGSSPASRAARAYRVVEFIQQQIKGDDMKARKALMMFAAYLLVAAACASYKKPGPGDCPPPKQSTKICPQVVVWAKNPQTGACCQYGTPCNAPDGWKTYNSETECRAGS